VTSCGIDGRDYRDREEGDEGYYHYDYALMFTLVFVNRSPWADAYLDG